MQENSACNYMFQFKKEKKRREAEERRRYPLEMRLRENIVGQDGAILTVAAGYNVILMIRDNYSSSLPEFIL